MRDRVLPVDEWPRLTPTLLGQSWPYLDPATSQVVVVEDDEGAIIGCVSLVRVWHLEGVWIAPAHRGKASVGRRLLMGFAAIVNLLRIKEVLTMTSHPDMPRLHAKLGRVTKLDCDHFAITLGA